MSNHLAVEGTMATFSMFRDRLTEGIKICLRIDSNLNWLNVFSAKGKGVATTASHYYR